MRKLIYILVLGLFIIGCQVQKTEEREKEELFFPEKADFINNSKLVYFELKSFDNYQNLIQTIDSITCGDKEPVLKFQNSKYKFNLIALHHCDNANYVADYRLKNVIGINNDSIIIHRDIKTTVTDLGKILKKHYLNKGQNPRYSDSPEKAVINLYMDPATDSGKIENLLERIATEFNEIKKREEGKFRLMILFKDYPMTIFPTPPMPEK